MDENIYKLKVICNNCDFRNEIEIAKGTIMKDATCPECGCRTLSKDFDPVIISPRYENFS